jgi:hypothetical protein
VHPLEVRFDDSPNAIEDIAMSRDLLLIDIITCTYFKARETSR